MVWKLTNKLVSQILIIPKTSIEINSFNAGFIANELILPLCPFNLYVALSLLYGSYIVMQF